MSEDAAAAENAFMIMGYNVEFPRGKRPFPAQFAVMNKVLTALKTEQHALLESPTGSGKTLALLCSTLTFQKQFVRDKAAALKREQEDPKLRQQEAQLRALEAQMQLMEAQQQVEQARHQRQERERAAGGSTQSTFQSTQETPATQVAAPKEDEDDEDEVVATQPSGAADNDPRLSADGWMSTRKRELEADSTAAKRKRVLPKSFAFAAADAPQPQQQQQADSADVGPDGKPKQKRVVPPRIFFCSRTHSQLAQVVDELKNCPVSYLDSPEDANTYTKQLQTCVLGSKRNMCVNRKVNRDPAQVDEKCRLALEGASCSYFRKRKKANDLRRHVPPVWDIEDLVKLAQKHRECAYFHAREALDHANIVFAPYNYLLDPTIRAAVGITLKDSIIVLDEAHNVEDTCRSSASVEVTTDVLAASVKAFSIVIKHGSRPKTYNALLKLLNGISRWLQSVDSNANAILQPSGYEEKSKVWDGADALAMLAEYSGLTQDNLAEMKANVQEVREYENELGNSGESSQQATQSKASQDAAANPTGASVLLGALALATVQSIMNVADYMFRDNLKFIDDFKLVVIKSKSSWKESARFQSPTKRNGGDEWELKMCIWCLNAAVAFSDVASQARSVILTSGTLSPMESFAGELGVDFPIRLEANHVVNMRKQVFIGAVMHGPGNVDLQSTYNNQQDLRYQDSMGQLLLQYAQAIPGGILMFFPSYSLLNKLTTRWKKTKLWGDIEQFKAMYSEPRNAGKDFDALLEDYKDTITKCSAGALTDGDKGDAAQDKRTGAIFLAVYRGKVSEGIDFSNDNARAVLCVGIPFPSVKELQVSLKRKYQDEKSRMNMKLVNGHVWYQLQAFRALNQALGRCIRHRQDYGAIMLLDSRHRFNKHTKSLSKWMRPHIQEFEHAQMCVPMFGDFFQRNRMELPQSVPAPPSEKTAGAASSEWKSKRAPLVLKYENDKKESAKAKRMVTPSLSSTLATVKDFMAKQKQDSDPQGGVFSIFHHQPPKKSS
ncbi:Fanconi anemia group J [Phytophthora fragariae]|uniref:Fanconi anemia group J n=1 Tax=Phytophthora fragariae TaxID=53985 RepID=A0A6A3LW95_9STRA|nr:Fanconi anemia group J [Phytophthora fragariae]KAE8944046.1 Fanconi anemia group J [Phytophthora fragariae]KAE9022480.1 Fanconi anemia group J [Phytophthora fragariae]KAE9124221.1 Fanconi anemia group J [Phytophthora fragariae]KAE9126753.1 Fanconi anemia group J [Phytophthora fragariae]